jgi:hypothetical protein
MRKNKENESNKKTNNKIMIKALSRLENEYGLEYNWQLDRPEDLLAQLDLDA